MKKVGIITLNGYHNYGNRLQNYALVKTLEKLNCEVETLIIHDDELIKKQEIIRKNRIRQRSLKANFIVLVNKLKQIFKKSTPINKQFISEREAKFKEFSIKHLNEKRIDLQNNIDKNYLKKFDSFISGSDQVWNPHVGFASLYINFLQFAPKEKRNSYAASFGVEEIRDDLKPLFTKYINEMNYISVRENQGQNIINNLSDKESKVLVDPTMLLTSTEWNNLIDSEPLETNYILTYYLGELSEDTKNKINSISIEKNLKIINLNDKDNIVYSSYPQDFLNYIKNAKIFFTDSFHGVVFSIIFKTPFIVFKRGNMNSRIDTILKKFGLENQKIENIKDINETFDMTFQDVDTILKDERNMSFSFLKETLNI